jgi:outer membrane immunogenic protein
LIVKKSITKMMLLFLGAAVTGAASGAAFAADALDAAAAAPVFNWTGFYIGAHAGGGSSNIGWVYQAGGTASHHGSGFLGGVQAGYNFQSGSWVFGGEADVSFAGIKGSTPCPNPAYACESHIKWLGSLRGRVGYASNAFLVYGTGGLGFGGVNVQTVQYPVPGVNGQQKTRVGWTLGAGAEMALSNHWTVKAEYMYYDLGKSTHQVDFGLLVDVKTRLHTGKIGLNYKF